MPNELPPIEQRPELLPCPFCGEDASLHSPRFPIAADCDDAQVICGHCDAAGPAILCDMSDADAQSHWPAACSKAIASWNQRPTPASAGDAGEDRTPKEVREAVSVIRYYKQRGADDLGCGEVEKLLIAANRLTDELIEYEQALTDAEASRLAAFDRWQEAERSLEAALNPAAQAPEAGEAVAWRYRFKPEHAHMSKGSNQWVLAGQDPEISRVSSWRALREIEPLYAHPPATPLNDPPQPGQVDKLREAFERWRDNLRITQGSPVAGDVLHGPALDFVIEQVDALLSTPADHPSESSAAVALLDEIWTLLTPPGNVWSFKEPECQQKAAALIAEFFDHLPTGEAACRERPGPSQCSVCETYGVDHPGACDDEGSLAAGGEGR